jgi:hypothetical protein
LPFVVVVVFVSGLDLHQEDLRLPLASHS